MNARSLILFSIEKIRRPLALGQRASREGRMSLARAGVCLAGLVLASPAALAAPTLYTVGDSTVQRYSSTVHPRAGWGQVLPYFFDSTKITIVNRAVGGTSARTFHENGYWAGLMSVLQPGDYVTIQFGINDSASDARHTDPATSFKDYLTLYVNDIRARGAFPLLVATQNRNSWNNTDPPTVFPTYADYAQATREVAGALDVPLIDLDARSRVLMESLGKTYSTYFMFHHYPPGEWVNFPNGAADDVHFQEMGAIELAKLVVAGLRDLGADPEISKLIPLLKPTYPITFNSNLPAAGWVSRSESFPAGIPVTAYVWPRTGYSFVEWSGAISGTRRHVTFTMGTAALAITANFAGSGSPVTATLYPAETANFGGGAYKGTNYARYHGSAFLDFPAAGGFVEFSGVDGGVGGSATIEARYALASGTRTGVLTVNGASQPVTFTPTGSFGTWLTHAVTVPLSSGIMNTIRFSSNGQDLPNLDEIVVKAPNGTLPDAPPPPDDPDDPPPPPPEPTLVTYQAETAAFGGGVKKENHYSGYHGSGFLNLPTAGGYVQFSEIDGGGGGAGTLAIRYALQSGTRTGVLIVNGVSQPLTFTKTGSFAKWQTHTLAITLDAGTTNTVRIESSGQDLANIDEITIGTSVPPDDPEEPLPPDDPEHPPPTEPGPVVTRQAEDAAYGGGVKKESHYAGFRGSGFLNYPTTGGYTEFSGLDGGSGGGRTLEIRYALQSGTRVGVLVVNGVSQPVSFPATGTFTTWRTLIVTVALEPGASNRIRLESSGQDLANVDEIMLR